MPESPTLDLEHLRTLSDEVAAIALDQRLRVLDAQERRSYAEKGLIVLEVEQRLLWRFLLDSSGVPFQAFTKWVREAAPFGYATCFAAKESVADLMKDLPVKSIVGMPRCNILTMQALSSQVRKDEEVIKAASTTTQKGFVDFLEEKHPEQHIESRRLIHLSPTKSASAVIEHAIKVTMQIEGLTTREQVLEFWATEYLAGHPDIEAEAM
jgi:hypothetical protein